MKRPELLAPAGDLERLDAALRFGADAVYLAGQEFGMRSAPANFTNEELRLAVEKAHRKGAKIYVTCNTLPRNDEFERLPAFLAYCQEVGVDAFILTDLGVLELAKRYAPAWRFIFPHRPVLSTTPPPTLFTRWELVVLCWRGNFRWKKFARFAAVRRKIWRLKRLFMARCACRFRAVPALQLFHGRDANHGDWRPALPLGLRLTGNHASHASF